ncbi:ATP-binding cassette domain-containing protein [Litorimonas haliclonae]|uniref:ABC transporter ATP-binding protein n=1 Tax=Litorimonas haliclonae TaxID=2081977 RepID=UPI0039EE3DFF
MPDYDDLNAPLVKLNGVYVEFPFHSDATKGVKTLRGENAASHESGIDSESGAPFRKENSKYLATALGDINMTIKSGDRLGLMGHNGAGKSTLIRVISGLLEPSRGEIMVRGRIASTISTTFGFDMRLTGRENIIRRGLMMRMPVNDVYKGIEDIISFAELGHYIDMPMGTYSSGMRARLGFAVTTSVDADVLVMDEWIGAGDPRFIEKCEERLSEMIGRSRILILASHNHKLLEKTCNKFAVLNKGRIERQGDFEAMQETGAIKKTTTEKLADLRKDFRSMKAEKRKLWLEFEKLKPSGATDKSAFEKLQLENRKLREQLKSRRDQLQQLKSRLDEYKGQ